MSEGPIRVLLVDDSPVARTLLARMLSTAPDIEVVGAACSGREALEMIPRLDPHVVCTDLVMRELDGFELIREILRSHPRPVLAISGLIGEEEPSESFAALAAGAVDVVPKPVAAVGPEYEEACRDLVGKIRVAAGVRVIRRSGNGAAPEPAPAAPHVASPARPRIIVVAASTGGPPALLTILRALPAASPPVVCIQHISGGFLQGLMRWLAGECRRNLKLAESRELPASGIVYFSPENRHLEFGSRGEFQISEAPPVNNHRPSATVTMSAAAAAYGSAAVGVLLTGMGEDGADGLLAIRQRGGLTIAQDEATSVVYGMPAQAVRRGAVDHELPLPAIAEMLAQLSAQTG
jgi:two-component system chemotaxis response regulator CheB